MQDNRRPNLEAGLLTETLFWRMSAFAALSIGPRCYTLFHFNAFVNCLVCINPSPNLTFTRIFLILNNFSQVGTLYICHRILFFNVLNALELFQCCLKSYFWWHVSLVRNKATKGRRLSGQRDVLDKLMFPQHIFPVLCNLWFVWALHKTVKWLTIQLVWSFPDGKAHAT